MPAPGEPLQSKDERTGFQRSEFVARTAGGWVGLIALWDDDPEVCAVNGEPFLVAVVATSVYQPNDE